jgi:CPA2 family monovalent cation:H+ antiporter-2
VLSVRRGNGKTVAVQDELVLQGGDTLVLAGTPEVLSLAEGLLVTGR